MASDEAVQNQPSDPGDPGQTPLQKVLSEIELPMGPAVWVMLAHVLTVAAPLTVLWSVHANWAYLEGVMHAPVFFYVGVAVLMSASSFEFAQNTIDRWYLTPETPSAEGHGLCDLLFFTLITVGLGCYAYAAAGEFLVVPIVSTLATLGFLFLYLTGRVPFGALGIAGWTMTLAMFWKLRDPVLFLQVACGTGMTQYFFAALLRTGNQVLHGFTTIGNGIGMLAIPWAIFSAASGEPNSWWTAGAVAAVFAVAGVALWKPLLRLGETPRRRPPAAASAMPTSAPAE